jgi:hypothetical protein
VKKSVLVLAAVAAVSALLLSLAGPALAAGHGHKATASTSKRHKKPKRGPRGPRGAQGPAGPTGPAGLAGKNGTNGKDGTNGKEGHEGKPGPSSFLEARNLDISSTGANSNLKFIGETMTLDFTKDTAAVVTASLGFGSTDGKEFQSHFGVCFKPAGAPLEVDHIVEPHLTLARGESVVQTISDTIEGVGPAEVTIGACSYDETANTEHGVGTATVLVGERPADLT